MLAEQIQLPTPTQRGWDRSSRLALGVVLLIAVASAVLSVAVLQRAGDGCVLDGSAESALIAACVGGWPTPLRAGDQVIAVDGIAQAQDVPLRQPRMPAGWVDGGTARYTVQRGDAVVYLDVPLHRMGSDGMLRAFSFSLAQQWPSWLSFAFVGASALFGLRPRARAAQLLLVALGGLYAVLALSWAGNSIGAAYAPAPLWFAGLLLNLSWGWLFAPTLLLLVLSFPRRVWPLAHYPRLAVALIYGLPLLAIAAALISANIVFYLLALGLGALAIMVAGVAVSVHTWLRVRDPVLRAQTGWLALGVAAGLAWFPIGFVLGFVFPGLDTAQQAAPWLTIGQLLPSLAFPICLGIAITRYRLFDIDLIINRALVYGALTACVIALYVLVVGYLGWLFRGTANLALSLIATGIVATLFAPLRTLLQRGVNRMMYGERDEPYRVLTRLGQQLEHTLHRASALALTVETVARALKLPYVAIALQRGGHPETVAAYGVAEHTTERVALLYGGRPIGELIAARRAPHEQLSAADYRLLQDLARQIGVAAHALALADDLEQARLRLVTERGEARRRLGSDLHDGVGHQLAGLTRQLERARRALPDDTDLTQRLLAGSTQQLAELSAQVRTLAHQLFPPELELLGLAGALQERAQTYDGMRVELDAPAQLPPLPAEIAAAVYLIALEALSNVEKHAQARRCRLRLRCSAPPGAVLELEVLDDGRGLAADATSGLGLLSMRARAAEVGGSCSIEPRPGGGTVVRARIPCPAPSE